MFDQLRGDLQFAIRGQRKTPMMTAVLVGTLALGIAATSLSFSLVNGFFIRPLAIQDPDRFVRIFNSSANGQYSTISYPDFLDLRDLRGVFSDALAEEPAPFSMGIAGSYDRVWGEVVSDGYFPLLGIRPAEGRFFAPDEETDRGREPVVVLSHGLWTRRFGGTREALNGTLLLDGTTFRIIGVAPPSFHGTTLGMLSELWIPVRQERAGRPFEMRTRRGMRGFFGMARLNPGASVEQGRAAIDLLARRLQREYPESNRGVNFAVLSESEGRIFPAVRGSLLGAAGVVITIATVVLLLACLNVAGVLLVRASARRAEIGVRLALGATRARIVAQLLTEAVLLSLTAGAIGIVLAWQATRVATAVRVTIARGAPISVDVGLDARVLAFSVIVTIVTAVSFGLAPAFEASHANVIGALKDGGRRTGGRRSTLRHVLVASQVAVSMVLLAGGGLFLRSLQNARHIDLGFTPDRVVTSSVDLSLRAYSPEEGNLFWLRLLDGVRRLPRTESASLSARLPLDLGISMQTIAPEGYQPPEGRGWPATEFATVGTQYLGTVGTPLLEGREFTDRDTAASQKVIILNDVLAHQFWPNESAIGRHVVNVSGLRYEVIGVARRSKYFSIGEEPKPYVYFPLLQGAARAMTVVARASGGDAAAYLRDIGDVVRHLDPVVPVYDVTTMAERVAMSMSPTMGGAAALGIVGVIALALTALGLYGVVAQTVAHRTYEIGVRRALGAQDRNVVWLVVGQAMALVVLGIVGGLGLGLGSARLLQRLLYAVDPSDPLVFGLAPLALVAICALASSLPTWHALRISAAAALRDE
jgi:putative ABC transport system permease protein